ncbi:PREDICTED: beta-galactosidase-like [Branchiostoma belcheri]|uniref:Beta-galactosidase n=1 Tax=Branchiostoma belcheri TaxID=7741 RepID=A0A6P4XLP9_BRABE|nr:PREDICTED: beta-galactosidase-like [Branchiostoma belcheri]
MAATQNQMFVVLSLFALVLQGQKVDSRSFSIDYDNNTFLKDGEPFRYISGSIHYSRVPRSYWQDRLNKMYAAGLNAIQTYVPWNLHEPKPGKYDFTGNNDIEAFLKLANDTGLLVILRPGPYICAEWDMGGLPSWLMKDNSSIVLRSSDPAYLDPVDTYMAQLLPRIKPYLYNNGGPIITVQVENEYGSFYTCDYDYLRHLRQVFIQHLGPDVVLFTTDGWWDGVLKCGTIDGLYTTVDFGPGTDPVGAFKGQRKHQPKGPLVNSEFYTGWLDHWGQPHAHTDKDKVATYLEKILQLNASVNMYMFEGGTNFGYMNGANGPFKPQPTSYDYDAPLTEAGDPTDKLTTISNVIAKPVPTSYDYDAPLSEAGDPTDKFYSIRNLISVPGEATLQPVPTSYDYDAPLSEAGDPTDKFYSIRSLISKLYSFLYLNLSLFSCGPVLGVPGETTFQPVPTSYDYDAPLSEAGDPTDKFYSIRSLIIPSATTNASTPLPPPKAAYGKVQMTFEATVLDKLSDLSPEGPIRADYPITMENMQQSYGFMLYRATLPAAATGAKLSVPGIRDRGFVMLDQEATVLDKLSDLSPEGPIRADYPITMENMQQSYGFMLYRATLPAAATGAKLSVPGIRDRGFVMLDQTPVGILSRNGPTDLNLTAQAGQVLDVVVENQGRINFGRYINDSKGIISNVTLGNDTLRSWSIYSLDIDGALPTLFSPPANPAVHINGQLPALPTILQQDLEGVDGQLTNQEKRSARPVRSRAGQMVPSFYTGTFSIQGDPQDTFLNMKGWTKGQAFVNGFNLGRYWPVEGPQITLYVPASVLKSDNNVTLFELEASPCLMSQTSDADCTVEFQDRPIINATVSHPRGVKHDTTTSDSVSVDLDGFIAAVSFVFGVVFSVAYPISTVLNILFS